MKLLHITATHLDTAGGVPVVLKNLVEEQNKINDFSARVLSLTAKVNNMESEYFDILGDCTFKQYIEAKIPDVVILHSFFYIAYCPVVSTLVDMKIPYYIEPHGSFGKVAMKKSRLKKIVANNTVFRKQLKYASGYVFLNQTEMKDSIYRTNNDFIIPNGINREHIRSANSETKDDILYFIGRYDINHKGLDFLISALKILDGRGQEFTIKFWGSGNEDAVRYLKEEVAELKNLKVEIGEPIFSDEKDKVLEKCGPMLLTSRYEGFPMTVLEAWAYGNPCIVTPGTNVMHEIVDNELGWGVELNAEAIADGIERAVKEYNDKKQLYISKCKEYVENKYTWSCIARDSYLELQKHI